MRIFILLGFLLGIGKLMWKAEVRWLQMYDSPLEYHQPTRLVA